MAPILGIDLGTTNTVVAVLDQGRPRIIANPETGEKVLPSVVGLDAAGELLVGTPARNQAALYPERTIRSVKRHMGRDTQLALGDRQMSPPEVSAIILRTVARWAEADLGQPVTKAVITVPAFFNDSQREATRRAGELAGLEVVRILNEPTAASLVYEPNSERLQRILVYDLGGGTFDVSILAMEGSVVEVLASHGDTHLGGDDFDRLLASLLEDQLREDKGLDVREELAASSRLMMAAEEAKKRLSFDTFTEVREEFLLPGVADSHLNTTVTREEFEELISSSLERTIDSVDKAMRDAQLHPGALDRVILVGGSTRIPAVSELLTKRMGQPPAAEIDPDMCVALGAAIQGGLIAGEKVGRVLVDITPHTLGIRAVDRESEYRFSPIIHRRTALPATRAETFYTMYPGQTAVEIEVFQGEDDDVRLNQRIGELLMDGLSPRASGNTPVSVQFTLNLDGIVHVRVVETATGKKAVAHFDRSAATGMKSGQEDLEESRKRVGDALGESILAAASVTGSAEGPGEAKPADESASPLERRLEQLTQESDRARASASEEDQAELDQQLQQLRSAADAGDEAAFEEAAASLDDLLFYLREA